MTVLAGDYQTATRMAAKLQAIPLPTDFTGLRVLDVGCDHGYWCKLASDRGAAEVVGVDRGRKVRGKGFVDLVRRNTQQQWPRCRFVEVDLGVEWPVLGVFDIVLCFSLYHHWYGQCGDHYRIWEWLAQHTAVDGMLLWEGPYDTKDSTAAQVTARVGDYTRAVIMQAAEAFFDLEVIGPAMHRGHREVWRGLLRRHNGAADLRDSVPRRRQSIHGVHRTADARGVQDGKLVPLPGDAQHASTNEQRTAAVGQGNGQPGAATSGDGARHTDRPPPVVARKVAVAKRAPGGGTAGARRRDRDALSRIRNAGVDAVCGEPEERRAGLLYPHYALILGGGSTVWDEVLEWEAIYGRQWDGLVIAANDVGSHWPRYLDHWVTLHPNRLESWAGLRTAHGFPTGWETWGRRSKMSDHQIQPWAGGASGMLAIQVASVLGVRRAVLCGIPMDTTPHFPESVIHKSTDKWMAVAGHWRAWVRHLDKIKGWVRSMSGRTMEVLDGKPTAEWLAEEPGDAEPGVPMVLEGRDVKAAMVAARKRP